MTDTDIVTKLAELEQRILYLEQQNKCSPDFALFGTWKEYPPTQAAPQTTPSYHCTYEHP